MSVLLNKYYLRSHVWFKSFQEIGSLFVDILVLAVNDRDIRTAA